MGWDIQNSSVADPGCLSRIPDPDFYPSRISDPGSRIPDPGSKNSNKRERWKKFVIILFFVVTNFEKFGFGIRDPRSGIRKKPIPDPGSEIRDPEKTYSGSRIQGSKRHRIPDPQHCKIQLRSTSPFDLKSCLSFCTLRRLRNPSCPVFALLGALEILPVLFLHSKAP